MGNKLDNKSKMKEIYFEISKKIRDKKVPASEIIWDIECAKREDPRFDINDTYYYCWTLLIYAVVYYRKKLLEYILKDPKINVNYKDFDGHTAFYYACFDGNIPILKLLLCHRDIDVNIQSREGWTG